MGFSLGMLVLAGADVAFLSWIIVPMLQKPSDRALGVVLLVVVVAIGIGMVAWMFRRGRGVQNRANSNRSIAAGGAAGGVVGSLLLIGSGLGFVLFFLGTVVSAGPLLAIFVLSLEPELYLERRARARLDRAS